MENLKFARLWGVAAGIVAAVVMITAAGLWITTPAKAQQSTPCYPAVTIQWQPQSILETVIAARISEDNKAILNGLLALAKNPRLSVREMMSLTDNTYLRDPRLWTKDGWIEGWENVLPRLKTIIAPGSQPVINAVSALILYQPYAGAKTPAEDVDARVRIRMMFSASPGDNFIEGLLCHIRPCPMLPCPPGTSPGF